MCRLRKRDSVSKSKLDAGFLTLLALTELAVAGWELVPGGIPVNGTGIHTSKVPGVLRASVHVHAGPSPLPLFGTLTCRLMETGETRACCSQDCVVSFFFWIP